MEVDQEGSVAVLQASIQQELKEIIKLQHIIQLELDELNNMTKPMGALSVAIKESSKSTEALAKYKEVPLTNDALMKFKKLQESMEVTINEHTE